MFKQVKIIDFSTLYLRSCRADGVNKWFRAEGTAGGVQAKRQRSAVPVACWTEGAIQESSKKFFTSSLRLGLRAAAFRPFLGSVGFTRSSLGYLGWLRYATPTLRSLARHSFSLPYLVGTRPCTYPRREPIVTMRVSTALFPNDFGRIGD